MDLRKAYYMTTGHIDGNYNKIGKRLYDKTQSIGDFFVNVILQRIVNRTENEIKNIDTLDVFLASIVSTTDNFGEFFEFLKKNSKPAFEQIDDFLYPLYPASSLYEKYNKIYNKTPEKEEHSLLRELLKNKEIKTVLASYVNYLKIDNPQGASQLAYLINILANAKPEILKDAMTQTFGKRGKDFIQSVYEVMLFSLKDEDLNVYTEKETKYKEELNKLKLKEQQNPEVLKKKKMDKLLELYRFKDKTKGIFDNIVGQREQLKQIMQVLYNAELGLNNPLGPKASMLLTGPTGVGKTETAYAIANSLFGDSPFVIDLSVYRGEHQLSTLIGSPPGYVGYNDKPQMLEFIKNHPLGGVLLFDEFDKANKQVLNIFMHMLDKGEVQSAKGESYDIRNFIIITTSNISEKITKHKSIGFGATDEEEDIKNVISGQDINGVPPELIARFDLVLAYQTLSKKDKIELARRKMDIVCGKIKKLKEFLNVDVKYDEKVLEELADSVNETMGIRELFRNVNNLATEKLVEYIMSNEYFTDFNIYINSLNDVVIKPLPKTKKRREFSKEIDQKLMETRQKQEDDNQNEKI